MSDYMIYSSINTINEIQCFMIDTQLLTISGYKKVQDIEIGDKLITYNNTITTVTRLLHEIVKGTNETYPYIIKRGEYGAFIDTYLSPLHMIYDGKVLNQVRNIPNLSRHVLDTIHYYHIETENLMLDLVYANGLVVETWIDGYPFSMKNSEKFGDLYKATYLNRYSRKLPY